MAPEIQAVVRTTQAWLQASHHVQVPYAWLEACVSWLQEEAGGAGRLAQQQINQQALDQWLMTDLRDLDHPVLPQGLAQAQKTELRGTFCVQVDSLLDISQPAYTQLQKLKGTDCANDEVSAVTQTTQRPWEARPTRMLLLQVTDGVQGLEAMEYQPIPALSAALRPGAKLQLQGQMVCRLGVLLLGPSHVRVLGGEVEDLVDRNCQDRVLCRTLGLPEERRQQQEPEEPGLAPQQAGDEMEDLDDAELLASLEEAQRGQAESDSGYGTHSDNSTQIWRSSSVRSFASTVSSRSEASARTNRSGLTPSNRGGSLPGQRPDREDLYFGSSDNEVQPEARGHGVLGDSFPDTDFDELPLDELDSEIFQDPPRVAGSSHATTPTPNDSRARDPRSASGTTEPLNTTSPFGSGSVPRTSDDGGPDKGRFVRNVEEEADDFMDEDMDCFLQEVECTGQQRQPPGHREPRDSERQSAQKAPRSNNTAPALTLTSPPFTYLCLLEDPPRPHAAEIRAKAFIVTLLGKLTGSGGGWSICASISDGTGYLDVELSDAVLTGLLGFSVAEKASLKRDPARRGQLDAGMKRCQEELVDMCCVMTIALRPEGGRALVTKAEPVSESMLTELERRK